MAEQHIDWRSYATSKIDLASLSAMVAETATFPIDITKTRLQLHGVSAFQVAGDIVRKEGVIGLYKGLSPAVIIHILYTPIRQLVLSNCVTFSSLVLISLFLYQVKQSSGGFPALLLSRRKKNKGERPEMSAIKIFQ